MADAFSRMMKSAARRRDSVEEEEDLEEQLVLSAKRSRVMADALEEDSPVIKQRNPRTRTQRVASPARKRTRTTGAPTDVVDRPAALTYERFRHLLVVFAYCGLSPARSFMNALHASSMRRADPVIGEIEAGGLSWLDAYQVNDTLLKPSQDFMETLYALSMHDNPAENITTYDMLHKCMHAALYTCEFSAAPASVISERELCTIDGKPCKPRERLLRISMRSYETLDTGDTRDFRYARARGDRPVTFHINERYFDLIFGTWYLYHFSFLVGQNCADWVEHVRSLPRKTRDAQFPGFDAASDIALAQMFVDHFHQACTNIRTTVVAIAQGIEKRNQEYKKRLKKQGP